MFTIYLLKLFGIIDTIPRDLPKRLTIKTGVRVHLYHKFDQFLQGEVRKFEVWFMKRHSAEDLTIVNKSSNRFYIFGNILIQ